MDTGNRFHLHENGTTSCLMFNRISDDGEIGIDKKYSTTLRPSFSYVEYIIPTAEVILVDHDSKWYLVLLNIKKLN